MATTPHPGGFDAAFVAALLDDMRIEGPGDAVRVLGISALQGTGKSTLAAQLVALAASRGLRAATLSLDDVYLDHDARAMLAREVHPLLATRGPPGTHDLPLALAVLDALRARRPVALPAFDKARDRRLPRTAWRKVDAVDLVVLEGWCLCTPAEDAAALATPINALERDEDPDGRWRRHCNDALARDYPALWMQVDHLLFLQPPGFAIIPEWRWQQECTRVQDPGAPRMDRAQVDRFVQHYERTSRQALRMLPAIADRVVALDAERRPQPPT